MMLKFTQSLRPTLEFGLKALTGTGDDSYVYLQNYYQLTDRHCQCPP